MKALRFARSAGAAGVVDAGAAAAATFIVQVYAVGTFEAKVLGVYALFMTAFILGGVVPTHLIFRPAQVASLNAARSDRTGFTVPAIRAGGIICLVSGAATVGTALVAPGDGGAPVLVPLAVTTALATTLSPIQDHIRAMLHLAGRSWHAAAVSGLQMVAIAAALAVLVTSDVGRLWIPLGALSVANMMSLLGGLLIGRLGAGPAPAANLRLRELIPPGLWLLAGGVAGPAGMFVAAALVAQLASPTDLGYYEAARVVARPIAVLGTGLIAGLGPASMEAAAAGVEARARRNRRRMALVMSGAGALYVALVGIDWAGNPVASLLPNAYEIGGLAALVVTANVANEWMFLMRTELVGGRRERQLSLVEAVSAAGVTALASLASVLRAFTIPLGNLLSAGIRHLGYRKQCSAIYSRSSQP